MGGVKTILYYAVITAALFFSKPVIAQSGDNEDAYKGRVAPGMTVQKMGNKDAYKSILPDGTMIRRQGDVRVIEGVGEYAARRFLEYDARLAGMSAEIKSLREEVAGLRKDIAESKLDITISKTK